MTIREVRINFHAADPRLTRKLNRAHSGFTFWFRERLKTIRPQLHGVEVSGVNILHFSFSSPGVLGLPPPFEWIRRLNWIQHVHVMELEPLLEQTAILNLGELMTLAAGAASIAPWPQVRAVEAILRLPITVAESARLVDHVDRWSEFVGEPKNDA